ncbi:MAG: hypothetical protein K2Z81_14775 [Cyanobacteria bacterium]|nr:hypothetical protein [Cyanobacteriota bacterium]
MRIFPLFFPVLLTSLVLVTGSIAADGDKRTKRFPRLMRDAYEARENGNYHKAIAIYEEIRREFPPDVGVYIDEGICYRRMGNFALAANTFKLGEQLAPKNVQLQLEFITLLLTMKDFTNLDNRLLKIAPMIEPSMPLDHLMSFRNIAHHRGLHKLEKRLIPSDAPPDLSSLVTFCCPQTNRKVQTIDRAVDSCLRLTECPPSRPGLANALTICCVNLAIYIWNNVDNTDRVTPLCRAAMRMKTNAVSYSTDSAAHLFTSLNLIERNQLAMGKSELALAKKYLPGLELGQYILPRMEHLLSSGQKLRALALIRNSKDLIGVNDFRVAVSALMAQKVVDVALLIKCANRGDQVLANLAIAAKSDDSQAMMTTVDLAGLHTLTQFMKKQNLLASVDYKDAILLISKFAGRLEQIVPNSHLDKGRAGIVYRTLEALFWETTETSWKAMSIDRTLYSRVKLTDKLIDPLESICKTRVPPYLLEGLAILYARCDELEAADRVMNTCVDRYPDYSHGRKLRAAIKLRLGDETRAFADLEILTKSGERCDVDDLRKLRRTFESALAAEVLLRRLRTIRYKDSADYLEREEDYYIAKAARTASAAHLVSAAATAVTRHDYAKALRLLEDAESKNVRSSRLHEVRSWALTALGRHTEARTARTLATELSE